MRVAGRIALASRNPGKLAELRALCGGALDLWLPTGPIPEVDEDQDSYLGNARKKAIAFAGATGLPALADDSGLEVDALGGRPGVHSARFGGPGLSDAERCRHLLEEIGARDERGARFRCVLVLARIDPGGGAECVVGEGVLEGEIARAARGSHGFGYDPLFTVPGLGGRTLAEIGAEEKNRISHRAAAMRALLHELGIPSR